MHINEYFRKLYRLERTGIKYDLDNIRKFLHKLGDPHNKLKFIHIAGTNGKGGTASILASLLIEHGLKTGLYTSPHILKYNERIQINGKFISDNYIKKFINDNLSYIKKARISFFEVTTAMAFKYFADKKIDVGVIEVGLGGRLDSTNVIDPVLSIITQIGIDHTQYLGKTLKSIAKEKIGIVKKSRNVIISDINKNLHSLFQKSIKESKIYFLDEHIQTKIIKCGLNEVKFSLKFTDRNLHFPKTDFKLPLTGEHQVRNAGTAVLASRMLLSSINRKLNINKAQLALRDVKKNTFYHGRFENIDKKDDRFIFDVSHNPDAIKLAISITSQFPIRSVVFGLMKDKDYKNALKYLSEITSPLIFTQPSYFRSRNPETLYRFYRKNYFKTGKEIFMKKKPEDALKIALGMENKGYILVIGSFFLVSDVIKILKMGKFLK